MRDARDIVFGVADQVLTIDVTEGRPSSVESVQVFRWDYSDDNDTEPALAGAASIETHPNTTTSEDIDPGSSSRRRIPLVDITGADVGRQYLILGDDGLRELVEVLKADDAGVSVRHPLVNDYASGSSFLSTRVTVTLDDDWCADTTKVNPSSGAFPMYRVRWLYVVGGSKYVAETYFNLVRYGVRHGVTPQDVEDLCAGWIAALPMSHRTDQGRRLIDKAFKEVKLNLAGVEVDDATVADTEVIDALVVRKTIALTEYAKYLAAPSALPDRYKDADKNYSTLFDQLVGAAAKTPTRDETGAGSSPSSTAGISRR